MALPNRSASRRRVALVLGVVAMLAGVGVAEAATVTEFSAGISPNSRPVGITAGPDGNLWFTEFDGSRVGRITPAGVVTEFSSGITPDSSPNGITAGPDGNIWFTELSAGRVGRITPAGVVTEFPVAGVGASLKGITAGPDGNVWVAEGVGRIGRLTPAGVLSDFSVGISSDTSPDGITAGPDGNVWFTANGGARVGRITPAGVVTEFETGIGGNVSSDITAGADGNLWFTAGNAGGRIGRITTAGVVTEFRAGSAGTLPGIAAGPDGNLWFAEGSGRIGRITPAGVVNEFSAGITPGSSAGGITAGPDGNLWFTQPIGNRIARITTDVSGEAPNEPVLGKSVTAQVVRGQVLVSVPSARSTGAGTGPKGRKFVPLTSTRQIPVGSLLDTRKGTVRLTSARGKPGATQTGDFLAGVFQVLQSRKRRAKGLTELRLSGSSFKRCNARRGGRASAAGLSSRTIRRLQGNARGRFRTRGRHSAATVRGTIWTMADRCDGTLTTVKRGKVAVRDFRRKRTVIVRAGKRYLARAPR